MAQLFGVSSQQSLGHIRVGHTDDAEFGVQSQRQPLLAHHRSDDQGKARRYPEGVLEHQFRKTIRDRFEVELADALAQLPPQHIF